MRRSKYPAERRGDFLDLTASGHDIWMHENNPDGWTDDVWRAFTARCGTDASFKERCQQATRARKPRPHPTEDGWTTPARVDPIGGLVTGMRVRRIRRIK